MIQNNESLLEFQKKIITNRQQGMNVTLAREIDRKKWDGYIDNFPFQPPLNRYCWKWILEDSYRITTNFFIALDDKEKTCGILPTYVVKDIKGRKRLYSLRFGLIADDDFILKELMARTKEYCESNKITSMLVTSGYRKIDTALRCMVKKTLIMELNKDEESTWKSLRDKTRNMIRKAIKSNLTAERGFHYLKEFYNIYTLKMLEKGIPIHSYRFFVSIYERFRENAELIIAKKDGRVVAGTLVLFSKDIAIYPFQVSLTESLKFAPNDFLIWETIKLCLQRGVLKLDMGESKEGGSVYQFKRNFGGIPQNIYYYTTDVESLLSHRNWSLAINKPTLFSGSGILVKFLSYMKKKFLLWMKAKGRLI